MKTSRMMILALAMAVALMAAPAVAQTINLKADVPFEFEAGNVMLNSGQASLLTITNNVIRLSDSDKHNAIASLIADDDRSTGGESKLIFHRYGERYILVRVETPDGSYKVHLSKREMKLAQQTSPTQVAVLAHAASAGK